MFCVCVYVPFILSSYALHLSVVMSLSYGSAEVTQEGVNTVGLFSSFYIFFLPHLPPAVLAFIFIARRVRPSLSLVDSDVDVCVYSRACRFQLLGSNLRKKIPVRVYFVEIRSHDLTVRRFRAHQLNHRGAGTKESQSATATHSII